MTRELKADWRLCMYVYGRSLGACWLLDLCVCVCVCMGGVGSLLTVGPLWVIKWTGQVMWFCWGKFFDLVPGGQAAASILGGSVGEGSCLLIIWYTAFEESPLPLPTSFCSVVTTLPSAMPRLPGLELLWFNFAREGSSCWAGALAGQLPGLCSPSAFVNTLVLSTALPVFHLTPLCLLTWLAPPVPGPLCRSQADPTRFQLAFSFQPSLIQSVSCHSPVCSPSFKILLTSCPLWSPFLYSVLVGFCLLKFPSCLFLWHFKRKRRYLDSIHHGNCYGL